MRLFCRAAGELGRAETSGSAAPLTRSSSNSPLPPPTTARSARSVRIASRRSVVACAALCFVASASCAASALGRQDHPLPRQSKEVARPLDARDWCNESPPPASCISPLCSAAWRAECSASCSAVCSAECSAKCERSVVVAVAVTVARPPRRVTTPRLSDRELSECSRYRSRSRSLSLSRSLSHSRNRNRSLSRSLSHSRNRNRNRSRSRSHSLSRNRSRSVIAHLLDRKLSECSRNRTRSPHRSRHRPPPGSRAMWPNFQYA
jgi:hypothetical protein